MTCSPARLAANRANAALSTGPKTEAGKAKSRANAMKHGLAAELLRTPDEAEAAGAGAGAGPAAWLEGEEVVLRMRIDRARRVEDRERDRAALRAGACWDDDRDREADRVARGLARRPDRVALRLRATKQGCAWMIARWRLLLAAAGQQGGWTDEQRALAFDLRGIPGAYRASDPAEEGQAAMATRQVAELESLRDGLGRVDAFERESATLGLDDSATPELRRAIRYEADLHRRLRWCRAQLDAASPPAPAPAAARDLAQARTIPARPAPAPSMPMNSGLDAEFADLDALFGPTTPHRTSFAPSTLPVSMLAPARRG